MIATNQLRKALVHLLFPDLCLCCDQELVQGEQSVCWTCYQQLPFTGFQNLKENPVSLLFAGRLPIADATALCYFRKQGVVQHMLHALKYANKPEVGELLGSILGGQLKAAGWQVDVVVPVPLHKARAHQRGYNQAAMIARGIAEALEVPCGEQVLRRNKFTETQTHKTRVERWQNVHDVFELVQPAMVKSRSVLLVDDVLTTGATLEACGHALLQEPSCVLNIAAVAWAHD